MKIIDLQQNTPEWHKFRQGGIGSSEIHQLMSSEPFSPYWQKLKREKLTGESSTFENEAMKAGRVGEVLCLKELQKTNPNLAPKCAIHDEFDYIRCSFDAIDGNEIHEIKTPQAKMLEQCLLKHPPQKWEDQLRWQMMIADSPEGRLEIWDGQTSHPIVYERNLGWDEMVLRIAKQFWDWVKDGQVPAERYTEIADEAKSLRLMEYRYWHALKKEAEEKLDKLKEEITDGIDFDFILEGTKWYKTTNASYDYKKMVQDFNIEIEKYKKQSKQFWKIAL